MTRKAQLEPHFSSDELKRHYQRTTDMVERRRWHLLWLVSEQWSIKQAAQAVGLNYDYAREIVKNYNQHSQAAIKNRRKGKHRSNTPSLLTPAQLKELKERLESPPADQGIWTGPKVAAWIAEKTGREKVYAQRGWEYLKKLHYSLKVPRPKHQKGDKTEQEAFKQRLHQRVVQLQQQYPNAHVEVWSFDEHRLGLKPILRRVWTLVGQRPVATVYPRYEWLYLYGYVHPKTGHNEWFIAPRVNVQWFNLVLQLFAQAVGAGEDKWVVLVLDQAGWHRSAKVEVPQGIILEPLPPYSPELQPAERLWALADEPLVNKSFETLDALEEVLCQRCRLLSTLTTQVQALTHYHWWPDPEPLRTG